VNKSKGNCVDLVCIGKLLVCLELVASVECWPALWVSYPGSALEGYRRRKTWFPSGNIPSAVPASNSSEHGKSLQRSWVRVCFRAGDIPSAKLCCRGSEREKFLQQSSNLEWEKSHCGVIGMFVGWPVTTSEWVQSHLGPYKLRIGCSS